MEKELRNFMEVCLLILLSLIYCYFVAKTVSSGLKRLILFLPIVCLFLYLPLKLTTIHLGGFTSFFISWLANFKILLFAFDKGPLASHYASASLFTFISLSCFPIKIQENPSENSRSSGNPLVEFPERAKKFSVFKYAIEVLLLAMLVQIYGYNDHIHPKIKLSLYSVHVYLFHDILFAFIASMARAMLGLELERPFNEPCLSTSLEDFWGHRWNLIVSSILLPSVYDPTLSISTGVIGHKWGTVSAIFATFLVVGVMHEVLFYHIGRVWPPSWEATWFCVLHALGLTVELGLKKVLQKESWQLPRIVSTILTVGFFMITEIWLFIPQFIRCKADVRAIEEYKTLAMFLKNSSIALFSVSTRDAFVGTN